MPKIFIGKSELEHYALQEIRSFPGTEYVMSVTADYLPSAPGDKNWTIHIFVREGGELSVIQHAVRTTKERLAHRYNLRRDS